MTARILLSIVLTCVRLSAQGGSVEGKVVATSNGQPVRKATVVLRPGRVVQGGAQRSTETYSTEADNYGNFVFKAVIPGDYQGVATRPRYGDVAPDRIADTTEIPQFTVQNGQRTTGIVIKLTPLGAIMGRVLDADGDPVRGANVEALQYGYIRGQQELQPRRTVQSNDRGEYRVFDLFPGKYLLRVSKQDRFFGGGEIRGPQPQLAFAQTYFGGTTEAGRASTLDLPAGGEIRGVDISMNRQGLFSIRGRLPAGAGNDPGVNVNVSVQRRQAAGGGFGGPSSSQTHDGQYEVSGLAPGNYIVTARQITRRDPTQPVQASLATQQVIGRKSVEIVNRDVDGADLVFSPPLDISGVMKITGAVSIVLASQRVLLQPVEPGSATFNGQVTADGTFTIKDVLPDLYQVRINSPGNAYPVSTKLGDQELPGRQLDLREGRNGVLTIVVSRESGRVEGKVTGEDGRPVAQVNVTLVPDQSTPDWTERFRSVLTDAQGLFAFANTIPQHYQVFAWKDAPRGAPQDPEFRKPFEKFAVAVDVEANKTVKVELKPITTEPLRPTNR